MPESKNADNCLTQGYTKRYFKLPCKPFFSKMNVVFVVVIILPALFLFSPAIFDLLSKQTTRRSDDSHLPQDVLSTELQSRMKPFLVRNSAVHKPVDNEFVVASRSPDTHSHG